MFGACYSLVGVVAYNDENTASEMANPKTGYFTGKWALNIPSSFAHGSVTCDKDWAYTNETVTITVTPDQGYKLESFTIETIDDGEPSGAPLLATLRANVDVTPGDEPGIYTFVMPAAPVVVNATFKRMAPSGIDDINAAKPKTGQRYDLMGRPVGNDHKGIVIEDGHKILVK